MKKKEAYIAHQHVSNSSDIEYHKKVIYGMTVDIFRACHGKLDPKRRLNCMEIFGLDFMIDDEFRPYLIEVNTNPCLELSCPLLARLVPNMVENALKIGMDPILPPPEGFTNKKGFIGDPCPE